MSSLLLLSSVVAVATRAGLVVGAVLLAAAGVWLVYVAADPVVRPGWRVLLVALGLLLVAAGVVAPFAPPVPLTSFTSFAGAP